MADTLADNRAPTDSVPSLPPMLVEPASATLYAKLDLPDISSNLFQRLIRAAHPSDYYARERGCAEMLCLLLKGKTTVSKRLLGWFAKYAGYNGNIDEINFRIDTEQQTSYGKRDDLRIIGRRAGCANVELLWTIEIKVAASFHQSTEAVENAEDDERKFVNQVCNYDGWLTSQTAVNKAGFVLALTDQKSELGAENLAHLWIPITWTRVGEKIAEALAGEPTDLLAKHAMSFITHNLWRTSEMSNIQLNFNDIALIRSFGILADDCEQKIDELVKEMGKALEDLGVGKGSAEFTGRLFKEDRLSLAQLPISGGESIKVGIGTEFTTGHEDYLSIWMESNVKEKGKDKFRESLSGLETRLQKCNAKWLLTFKEEYRWAGYVDVELTQPLSWLLAETDHLAAVRSFVQKAVSDLKTAGVLEALHQTMR
jgi:hypothetical protein